MAIRWMMMVGMGLLTVGAAGQDTPALKNQKEKLSYALGADLGSQIKKQAIDLDSVIFGQGLKDALSGNKTLLTEEEIKTTIAELQNELRKKQLEGAKVLGEKNKKEGDEFLAQNKTREGVVTLPSGLQYKILKAGEGKKPGVDDTVVCHYRGTLVDGTEFDSSYKRSLPATFAVKGVIRGWTEALQLMPVGSKWQLFIPSALAYGERGAGPAGIGPNATLIFEVELISIQNKP